MSTENILSPEAVLRLAVIENHQREMKEIDSGSGSDFPISQRQTQRMNTLFAKDSKRRRLAKTLSVLKRVAVVILIAAVLLFGALLTQPDVRAAIRDVFIHWFAEFTMLDMPNPANVTESSGWEPEYLPQGFAKSQEDVFGDVTIVDYTNQNGLTITLEYSSAEGVSYSVDNEHSEYSSQVIESCEYHIFNSTNPDYSSHILWKKDGYSFLLYSNLDSDELLRTALSVAPKK